MSECHKCKQEMTMTPVCGHCGIIPIAEGSFKHRDDRITELEAELAEARARLEASNAIKRYWKKKAKTADELADALREIYDNNGDDDNVGTIAKEALAKHDKAREVHNTTGGSAE